MVARNAMNVDRISEICLNETPQIALLLCFVYGFLPRKTHREKGFEERDIRKGSVFQQPALLTLVLLPRSRLFPSDLSKLSPIYKIDPPRSICGRTIRKVVAVIGTTDCEFQS